MTRYEFLIGGQKDIAFEIEKTEAISRGGEYKQFVRGNIRNRYGRTRAVSLVEKEPCYNGDKYFEKWQRFKEVGLPVVPSMRMAAISKNIVMTDLTADGTKLYGKALAGEINKGSRERLNELTDRTFIQVTSPDSLSKIQEKAFEYAAIATKNNVTLPPDYDAFELAIHPDKSWELFILDLTWAQINSVHKNDLHAETFIRHLQFIRDSMLNPKHRKRNVQYWR